MNSYLFQRRLLYLAQFFYILDFIHSKLYIWRRRFTFNFFNKINVVYNMPKTISILIYNYTVHLKLLLKSLIGIKLTNFTTQT